MLVLCLHVGVLCVGGVCASWGVGGGCVLVVCVFVVVVCVGGLCVRACWGVCWCVGVCACWGVCLGVCW